MHFLNWITCEFENYKTGKGGFCKSEKSIVFPAFSPADLIVFIVITFLCSSTFNRDAFTSHPILETPSGLWRREVMVS